MSYLYYLVLILLFFALLINKKRYKNQIIYYKKEVNKYKKLAWDKKINDPNVANNTKKINDRMADFEAGKIKLVQDIMDTDFTLNPQETKEIMIDAVSNIEFYGKDDEDK